MEGSSRLAGATVPALAVAIPAVGLASLGRYGERRGAPTELMKSKADRTKPGP